MSLPADLKRRRLGLLYLMAGIVMVVWGLTVLKPFLKGLGFVLYWLACMGFTCLALLTALLDLWIVRIRARQERKRLEADAIEALNDQACQRKAGQRDPTGAPRA